MAILAAPQHWSSWERSKGCSLGWVCEQSNLSSRHLLGTGLKFKIATLGHKSKRQTMAKKHGGLGKGGTARGHGWALGLTPANVNVLATNPPLSYPISFKPKSIHLRFPPPFPYSPKPGSLSPMYHHCSALSQRHGGIGPSQDLLFCLWSLLSNQEVISYIFGCEPSL